jgi:hypothetical protein
MGMSRTDSSGEQFGTNVWGPQQGYLTDLYGQAQQQAKAAGYGQAEQGQGLNAVQQAQQALAQSGQYGQGMVGQVGMGNQIYGQSAYGLGQMAQGAGSNPQMDAYAQQVGQQFRQQIMPALQGQSAVAGQLGSSRAQIGQAMAADQAQQNIQQYSQQLYNDEQNRRLSALQSMQGAGQGYMQGAGALGQAGQLQQGVAGGQLDASQAYGQWAQFAQQQPWYNLQQYAGIVGGPTMQDLGGQQRSRSRAWNQAGSVSMW